MPKQHKPSAGDERARLARLPRRADLMIVGGKRTLGLYLREGKEVFQPQIVIWQEAESGIIRKSEIINPTKSDDNGVADALQTLVQALMQPPPLPFPPDNAPAFGSPQKRSGKPGAAPQFQPGLPARIIINDPTLALAAKSVFTPLNVQVEYTQDIPMFDAAFESLSEHLGADDQAGPPEPFAWDLPLALLSPLYSAAAGFWRRAPWSYLPDHPPVVIQLGENGPRPDTPTLYASILGAAGLVPGVAFYYSQEALDRFMQRGMEITADDRAIDEAIGLLRQAGVPVDQLPPDEVRMALGQILAQTGEPGEQEVNWDMMEEGVVCFFNPKDECDPTYLDWMKEHGLKYPARDGVPTFLKTIPGKEPENPGEREVKALTLAMEALNQFFSHFHATMQAPLTPNEPLTHQARVNSIQIEVSYIPAEEEEEEEEEEEGDWLEGDVEPDEPASATATTTLYRFQVKLDWMKTVWRRIEMRGDQTLHDLHETIQEAFDWDNDHLYAFFLSGKAWDNSTSYESPYGEGERNAAKYRLERLPLKQGQQFLYLFDFGDELLHQVKLEAIIPGGVKPGAEYPQITEEHGEAPPQYPMMDDE